MICPYCGEEMEFGNIVQREPVNWIPGNKPKTIFFNLDRATILAYRLFWASAYPSYVCHKCRKLIADFPEEEQSEPLNNKEEDLW